MKSFKCDLCEKYVDKGHNTIRVYGRKYCKTPLWGQSYELCDKCIEDVLDKLKVIAITKEKCVCGKFAGLCPVCDKELLPKPVSKGWVGEMTLGGNPHNPFPLKKKNELGLFNKVLFWVLWKLGVHEKKNECNCYG